MQDTLHWSHVLTGKLTDRVKLVGATISCEQSYLGGDPKNTARQNPHVQSYFMATDQVGLTFLVNLIDSFFHSFLVIFPTERALMKAGETCKTKCL